MIDIKRQIRSRDGVQSGRYACRSRAGGRSSGPGSRGAAMCPSFISLSFAFGSFGSFGGARGALPFYRIVPPGVARMWPVVTIREWRTNAMIRRPRRRCLRAGASSRFRGWTQSGSALHGSTFPSIFSLPESQRPLWVGVNRRVTRPAAGARHLGVFRLG